MKTKSEERIGRPAPASRAHCPRHTGRRRGGQPGNMNALKHGNYTMLALGARRYMRELMREARAARREARLTFERA